MFTMLVLNDYENRHRKKPSLITLNHPSCVVSISENNETGLVSINKSMAMILTDFLSSI